MKKLLVMFLMLGFAFGLTACGEEEMCVGKGGIEYPCDEMGDPTELTYFTDGTYIVGTDIEPGLHYFNVNTGSGTVERLDSSDQVIASQESNGRYWIEVKATDAKVTVSGGILYKLNEYEEDQTFTVWNEGGYLVGDEIPTGDYLFKMEPGETEATLIFVSAVDFEDGSIVTTYTSTDATTGQTITIDSTVFAVYVEGGHLVAPE